MTKNIVSIVISVALSLSLLLGDSALSTFALYVCAAFNVLAWIGVLGGGVKGEAAERIRKSMFVSLPSSILQICALIYSGHPAWAASSAVVSILIVCKAFAKEKDASHV